MLVVVDILTQMLHTVLTFIVLCFKKYQFVVDGFSLVRVIISLSVWRKKRAQPGINWPLDVFGTSM